MSNASVKTRRSGLSVLLLAGLLVLPLASDLEAQISRYPDPARDAELSSILSGLGAGSALRPDAPSGVSVEAGVVEAGRENALTAELGYLRWERWWHESLYEMLRNDRRPTTAAADGLVRHDALEVLRSALRSGHDEERRAAALALARSSPEGVVGDLVFALSDSNEEVRTSIVLALGLCGAEEARSYLDALVRDNRFGRSTLGSRRQPIPRDLRCVAALALGLLPPRETCTAIHDILAEPAEHHPDLYLAAALGLGLQGAAMPAADDREGRFGMLSDGVNPCAARLKRYLELLGDETVDARARGALLGALMAAAPREFGVLDKALEFLASDKVVLSRSAAVALQRVDPEHRERALEGLWSRVADRSDATAAGLALVTIGRIADDEAFRKLVETVNLNPALQPYQAFAMAEASRQRPLRRAAALLRLRSMLDRALVDDQSGLGAIMLALGLLHDDGSVERLEAIASGHDAEGLKAAATLSLSLAGGKVPMMDDLAGKLIVMDRDAGFLVHNGALALALSRGADSIEGLASILENRRDEYSLGGIARAIGLVGDPKAIPLLIEIAENPKEDASARAFALGAIGLLLERRDFPMSRLREIAPLPIASRVLRETLSHL